MTCKPSLCMFVHRVSLCVYVHNSMWETNHTQYGLFPSPTVKPFAHPGPFLINFGINSWEQDGIIYCCPFSGSNLSSHRKQNIHNLAKTKCTDWTNVPMNIPKAEQINCHKEMPGSLQDPQFAKQATRKSQIIADSLILPKESGELINFLPL